MSPSPERGPGRQRRSADAARRQGDGAPRLGSDEDWVVGLHPVAALLEAGRPVSVLWRAREVRDGRVDVVLRRGRARGVAVVRVPRERIEAVARGRSHQGIAARVSPVELHDVATWLSSTAYAGGSRVLVALDRVSDEGNAGAIVRSAAAFGAHGLLLPSQGGVRAGAGLARTASGGLEHVPLVRAPQLASALADLRGAGFRVLGAVVAGGRPLSGTDRAGDRVLVVGSESGGVSREVERQIDERVTIPTRPGCPALNVASAAAILLAWLLRALPPAGLDTPSELS